MWWMQFVSVWICALETSWTAILWVRGLQHRSQKQFCNSLYSLATSQLVLTEASRPTMLSELETIEKTYLIVEGGKKFIGEGLNWKGSQFYLFLRGGGIQNRENIQKLRDLLCKTSKMGWIFIELIQTFTSFENVWTVFAQLTQEAPSLVGSYLFLDAQCRKTKKQSYNNRAESHKTASSQVTKNLARASTATKQKYFVEGKIVLSLFFVKTILSLRQPRTIVNKLRSLRIIWQA